jgi:hypothetical protein
MKAKKIATASKPAAARPPNGHMEEKANSRTSMEPELLPPAQSSAPPDPVPKSEAITIGGKTAGPALGERSETSEPVQNSPKLEGPATGQPSETPDPVLKKAKITVAAKMENPASAEFANMRRATRQNTFGQSFEVICGHVKGKKKSGEATDERPFLYLVKEDEAFIVGSNPDSMAAIAYRAHCTSPNSHR